MFLALARAAGKLVILRPEELTKVLVHRWLLKEVAYEYARSFHAGLVFRSSSGAVSGRSQDYALQVRRVGAVDDGGCQIFSVSSP